MKGCTDESKGMKVYKQEQQRKEKRYHDKVAEGVRKEKLNGRSTLCTALVHAYMQCQLIRCNRNNCDYRADKELQKRKMCLLANWLSGSWHF